MNTVEYRNGLVLIDINSTKSTPSAIQLLYPVALTSTKREDILVLLRDWIERYQICDINTISSSYSKVSGRGSLLRLNLGEECKNLIKFIETEDSYLDVLISKLMSNNCPVAMRFIYENEKTEESMPPDVSISKQMTELQEQIEQLQQDVDKINDVDLLDYSVSELTDELYDEIYKNLLSELHKELTRDLSDIDEKSNKAIEALCNIRDVLSNSFSF